MLKEQILDVCLRRGFFWPSFEIYGGCKGFYDYGPMGALMKRNIEELIRKAYVIDEGCLEVSSPTVSPEDLWVASGHVDSFADMLVECSKCGEPYRADHLVEEHLKKSTDGLTISEINDLIKKNKFSCPKCKGALSDAYDYNLMFQTYVGPGKYKVTAYLRPETAQTTYVQFKRLFGTARSKLPFGVIQFGRSFRNEISPRQGIIRLREFNQAEAQFFVEPEKKTSERFSEVEGMKVRVLTAEEQKTKEPKVQEMTLGDAVKKRLIKFDIIAYFLGKSLRLYKEMGIDEKKLRLRQHMDDERAFYSTETWDVEYMSDAFGRVELVGVSDRTDYDLTAHEKLSKEDMHVNIEGKKFIPHVIEVAYGIDRPIYCVLESCFVEQKGEKERTYFKFPGEVAPYRAAVFSLVSKDGLEEKARDVFNKLREQGVYVLFDSSGSIGRRYARADEVGIPYCVTIDYDTIKDDTVTIRNRDSMEQKRVKIAELHKNL